MPSVSSIIKEVKREVQIHENYLNHLINSELDVIREKILNKNPRYDLAFYFKCNIDIASKRRWSDLGKKVPLIEVKKSLLKRTKMDKSRKHSPLKKVKDAILIRTDRLSKKEVLRKMSNEVDKIV